MQLRDKTIGILVERNYQEMEVWYPYYRFKEEGAEVLFIGPEGRRTYLSKHGYPLTSDISAKNLKVNELQALVIPGGYAPDYMRRDPAMVQCVADRMQAKKLVGAICHGGWMLCSSGYLEGRRATSFYAIKDDMINAGADWVDQDCVRDGHLVTSRQPEDLPLFVRTIIGVMVEDQG